MPVNVTRCSPVYPSSSPSSRRSTAYRPNPSVENSSRMRSMNSADCSGVSGAGKYSITRGSAFMAVNVPRSSSRHARSTSRGVGAGKIISQILFWIDECRCRIPNAVRISALHRRRSRRRVFSGTGSAASDCSCLPGVYRSPAADICPPLFLFGRDFCPAVFRFVGSRPLFNSVRIQPARSSALLRPGFNYRSDRPLFCGPDSTTGPVVRSFTAGGNSPRFLRPYSATSFFERLRVLIVR